MILKEIFKALAGVSLLFCGLVAQVPDVGATTGVQAGSGHPFANGVTNPLAQGSGVFLNDASVCAANNIVQPVWVTPLPVTCAGASCNYHVTQVRTINKTRSELWGFNGGQLSFGVAEVNNIVLADITAVSAFAQVFAKTFMNTSSGTSGVSCVYGFQL